MAAPSVTVDTTPQRIPPELLAITPPTVAVSELAGSGPSRVP